MQPVIYDVAISADGFIAGASDDVSLFPHISTMVDDYYARLKTYAVCLMGRRTYEFGYDFGLKPGENPYPAMRSLVFSSSISLPDTSAVEVVSRDAAPIVADLRQTASGPVYLCGGGAFASSLLREGLIDRLRLKRAPILLGRGIRLFGPHSEHVPLKLLETICHADGALFQEFALR